MGFVSLGYEIIAFCQDFYADDMALWKDCSNDETKFGSVRLSYTIFIFQKG